MAQVSFSIRVEAIDSKLIQVIPLDFAKEMAVFLLSEEKGHGIGSIGNKRKI